MSPLDLQSINSSNSPDRRPGLHRPHQIRHAVLRYGLTVLAALMAIAICFVMRGDLVGIAMFVMFTVVILWLTNLGSRSRDRAKLRTASAQDEAARLETESSERRSVDDKLRQSQSGLERAQRIAHVASWELDLATNRFTWSDEMYRIVGIEPTDRSPTMQDFFHAIHPGDRDQVVGVIDEAINEHSSFNVDHRILRPDGAERTVNQHGELEFDGNGRPVRMHGAVLDITDRHRFEQELRMSETRMRLVIDSALDAVVLTDSKGLITEWNAQAVRLFGWTRDQALGRSMVGTIIPAPMRHGMKREFRRILRSGGGGHFMGRRTEAMAVDDSGREFPIELTIAPVELDHTIHFSAFIRDISDRKRSEQALRTGTETQKLLLSELNHRVRNNLAGLISLIDLSASNATDIPTLAATISRRVHSMAAVHSMLSHNSWESLAICDVVHRFSPSGRRGRICAQGPRIEIPAPQCTAFGMVVSELMANSLKYGALSAEQGLVEVRWSFDDGTSCGDQCVRLAWVERGGPPIEREPVPQVGTNLIRGFIRSDLRGKAEMSFPRAGAMHQFMMTLDSAQESRFDSSK
jgi:PAS domain S-box-containing protein